MVEQCKFGREDCVCLDCAREESCYCDSCDGEPTEYCTVVAGSKRGEKKDGWRG